MKKLLILLVVMAGLSAMVFASGEKDTYSLTVLHTNDTHGHPLPYAWSGLVVGGVTYNAIQAGGLPARATYVKQVRSEQTNVVVLDAGDVTTGLVVSNYFKASPDILGMNAVGYDAMALGNHEFDNGIAELRAREKEAKFPMLSANIYEKASGKLFAKPYALIKLKDITVGVIGLTTPETVTATLPANVEALEFRDPVETLKKILPEVKSKSKFVIVLSHLGLEADRDLAAKVSEINLIIGGHSHSPMDKEEVVNGTPIFQDGQWGATMGRVDIEVKDGKVVSLKAAPVGINLSVDLAANATPKGTVKEIGGKKYDFVNGYIEPDAELAAALKPYQDQVSKELETVIGTAVAAFPDTKGSLTRYPRRDDSALSNMVTDAMREETSRAVGKNVDVFLQNGGGIRATLPAGPITKAAVYAVLPFDNTIQTVNMTGAQLIDLLNKTALPVAVDNYVKLWDGPNGAFLQVSGLSYTIDIAAKTISDIKVGGQAIDPAKTYLVASQNFMMTGGDGYVTLKDLPGKFETSMFQRDAALAWIERKKTIDPAAFEDDRIKIVNGGR